MNRTLRVFKNAAGTPGTDVVTTALKSLTDQVAVFKTSQETAGAKALEELGRLGIRLDKLEASGNRRQEGIDGGGQVGIFKSLIENPALKEFLAGGRERARFTTPLTLRAVRKALLTSLQDPYPGSPSSSTYPVAPNVLPNIYGFAQRPLTLLDVLPHLPSGDTNIVEYPKLTSDNKAADVQLGEGVDKAERSMDFILASAHIATVAVTMPVARQVTDDSPQLAAFVQRLLGIDCTDKLERLLISGNGGSDKIWGLQPQATAYVPSGINAMKNADRIGSAAAYMKSIGLKPDVVVMNPLDWFPIQSERDAQGRYVTRGWDVAGAQSIYGMNPVETMSLAKSTALIVDSSQTAILDRMSVDFELGYVGNQFKQNQRTALAELRAGFTMFHEFACFSVPLA
jgi:HK97 family phage major capsid protein